jgi:uncharacterized protein with HEPN domain
MQPESAKFLRDMLDAAEAIEQHTANRTEDDYVQQRWLRDAANWNFCVIGEALSKLNQKDSSTAQRITDSWKIMGLRNQLIHGYGVINHRIVWNVIRDKLPLLIQELRVLLAE